MTKKYTNCFLTPIILEQVQKNKNRFPIFFLINIKIYPCQKPKKKNNCFKN